MYNYDFVIAIYSAGPAGLLRLKRFVAGGIPLSPDSEGEESEEESEVLEESPCGRWRKMRAEVS